MALKFVRRIFSTLLGGLRDGGDREVGNRKADVSPQGSERDTYFTLTT